MIGKLGGSVTAEAEASFKLQLTIGDILLKEVELMFAHTGTNHWEIEFEVIIQANNQLVFQGHLDYLNDPPEQVSLRSSTPIIPTGSLTIHIQGQWLTAGNNTFVTDFARLESSKA